MKKRVLGCFQHQASEPPQKNNPAGGCQDVSFSSHADLWKPYITLTVAVAGIDHNQITFSGNSAMHAALQNDITLKSINNFQMV